MSIELQPYSIKRWSNHGGDWSNKVNYWNRTLTSSFLAVLEIPTCLPVQGWNFGGGPGTFCWFFFNFMLMIWDSRHEDLQLFWLSLKHCFLDLPHNPQISHIPLSDDRADSRFAPSQWETALLCNNVSHWLGPSLESPLRWSNIK